ncbi:hypothetical protein MNEG_8607 [Monoraphidium neglectum]|uniref:MIF4G domain-containing protein n=1 Tax=Monoraphidium neglectum TaxID=145388 RepID=A0A0D2KVD6_9CHLO|nr:hypothetical protein MNEG_8607 [Monoraphidium neglectum]KIY99353.1 hypothetical protein MNEG_8607 [Monoraphidium neglectum]|eukprot:XP_013898373.1 hypothetical protein MNEG_8607 [Monoraphidium neglectum]
MASGDAATMAGDAAAAVQVTAADLEAATQELEALREQLETQRRLAEANLNPKRPDEPELSRRDSSIKKNAAMTKKLRAVSEEARAQLLAEVGRINMSKYVSEAVAALSEAPPSRANDAAAAVQVASALHQTYPEFGAALGAALAKAAGARQAGEDERTALKRQRAALRLLGELQAARVVVDAAPLLGVVRDLVGPPGARGSAKGW